MWIEGAERKRFGEACGRDAGAGEFIRLDLVMPDATPGPGDRGLESARTRVELRMEQRKAAFTSSRTSVCLRRGRAIGKKIIGRSVSIFRVSFHDRDVFIRLVRALPLFDKPAGEHGGGIFLYPKVEKCADLLAEIGGMAEPREFIALKRVSGSGEQELPRRLGLVMVHAGLLEATRSTLTLH